MVVDIQYKYFFTFQEVDLTVVGNSECENKLRRTRLGYEFNLHSGFLCAGGEEGKDACKVLSSCY
jgi:hypothetical protein